MTKNLPIALTLLVLVGATVAIAQPLPVAFRHQCQDLVLGYPGGVVGTLLRQEFGQLPEVAQIRAAGSL